MPHLDQAASWKLDKVLKILLFINAFDGGDDLFLQNILAAIHRQVGGKTFRRTASVKEQTDDGYDPGDLQGTEGLKA